MLSPIALAFIQSAIVPALVAALLVFGIGARKGGAGLQALILACAYFAGSYVLLGRMSFPPSDVGESLSFVALLLAIFVFIAPSDHRGRYGVRAVFVFVAGLILLWHIRARLGTQVHLRNMIAFYCLALGIWSIVERAEKFVSRSTLILLPLISATAVSLLLLFSASASFSQLVSILCTILGAMLVLAWIMPSRLKVEAVLPFLSVFIVCFMTAGNFYLDTNPWFMVYLCLPFLVLWVRNWIPVPKYALIESVILSALAAAPVGYFLWNLYKSSGPLY